VFCRRITVLFNEPHTVCNGRQCTAGVPLIVHRAERGPVPHSIFPYHGAIDSLFSDNCIDPISLAELPGTTREIFKRHVQPTAKSIRSQARVRESVLGPVWHVSTGCSNCGCYSSHCIGTGFPEQVCRRGEILTRHEKSLLLYNERNKGQRASRTASRSTGFLISHAMTWTIRLQLCKHMQWAVRRITNTDEAQYQRRIHANTVLATGANFGEHSARNAGH
jgi:hypothetical protein